MLVTGGAGFLGSHLCERLLGEGAEVVCVDNFDTGSLQNLAGLRERSGFEVRRHDVTVPLELEVDEVYNLACPASPVHSQRDPIGTTRTSVLGALNLLSLAARLRVPILQASTSEVYGDPEVHPQVEGYRGRVNPIGPRACYDEGKRCAESLFLDHHRQLGVAAKIARIFNTYGPRMDPADGRVVPNFVVQALTGAPLTVYGDGSQTRSFCYVDDLVAGLLLLMSTPERFTGPVNLGNPVEFSIAELAETVLALTASKSEIVRRPLPPDDPARRCPDVALAREALGWEPRVSLREGLLRTIAYFDARLRGEG